MIIVLFERMAKVGKFAVSVCISSGLRIAFLKRVGGYEPFMVRFIPAVTGMIFVELLVELAVANTTY
jgi:hypothetical protein